MHMASARTRLATFFESVDLAAEAVARLPTASVAAETRALLTPMLRALEAIGGLRDLGRESGNGDGRPLHARLGMAPGAVGFLPLARGAGWTAGCFVFAPLAAIPLHDHPGMTGVVRVLEGDLLVQAFDWCGDGGEKEEEEEKDEQGQPLGPPVQAAGRRQGGRKVGRRRAPTWTARALPQHWVRAPETVVLTPVAGNAHALVAGQDGAAMLDVLFPDYDDDAGRPCRYYRLSQSGRSGAIAKEAEKEEASAVCGWGDEADTAPKAGAVVELEETYSDVHIATYKWPEET